MARRGRSVSAKGRSKPSERHVRFHQWMMNTAAFRHLDPFEVRVLLELYALFNGNNNGYLFLSVREAGGRCNMGKNKAAECLKTLQRLGFIRRRADEPENFKLREAKHWILTEYDCFGRPATCDFMHWKPGEEANGRPESNTPRPGSGTNSAFPEPIESSVSRKRDKKSKKLAGHVPEKGHSYNHHIEAEEDHDSLVST